MNIHGADVNLVRGRIMAIHRAMVMRRVCCHHRRAYIMRKEFLVQHRRFVRERPQVLYLFRMAWSNTAPAFPYVEVLVIGGAATT